MGKGFYYTIVCTHILLPEHVSLAVGNALITNWVSQVRKEKGGGGGDVPGCGERGLVRLTA
jgi:hypothetical protein